MGQCMAFALLRHAVRLVFTNWRDALKISAVLYLMQAGFAAVVAFNAHPLTAVPPSAALGTSLLVLASVLIQGVLYTWVAVAWHRFVLLDEMPNNYVPMFNTSRILGYIGGWLLITLVIAGVAIIGFIVVGIFGVIHATIIAIPIGIVLAALLILMGYRLGLILPAASVDRRLTLRDSWTATRGSTWLIIRLALLSFLAVVIIELPVFLLASPGQPNLLTEIWATVVGWFVLMVGVALLTTLYGYFVEHRPIQGMPMPPQAPPPAPAEV